MLFEVNIENVMFIGNNENKYWEVTPNGSDEITINIDKDYITEEMIQLNYLEQQL